MDVEKLFVSKVLIDGEIREAFDAKINGDFFEDEKCAEVWAWICDHWQRYGQVPGKKALDASHPTFKVVAADEPLQYYIDLLTDARAYAIMEEGVSLTARHLKLRDVSEAKATLSETWQLLSREVSPIKDIDITETGEERIERYSSYRDLDGSLRGMPSGFRFIDYATLGYQPEQLITYVGLPKAGKSTILLLNAKAVQDFGKQGLFIGFEMANEEQEARYDAFSAHVNWRNLMAGALSPPDWKRLQRSIRENSNKPALVFGADRSATTTVSGVAAKIEQYKPSICFVDGVYMMQSELPGVDPESPQALTNITRNFKRLAQRMKIPIVITTQVLPGKFSARRGVTIDSIGYTSSFAQDSDVIIGVEDTDDRDLKRLRIVAGRNVRSGRTALIRWDWESAEFEELEDEGGDDEPADPV